VAQLAVGPDIETGILLDRDHVVEGAVLGMLELVQRDRALAKRVSRLL
jgi:hypothetical protein